MSAAESPARQVFNYWIEKCRNSGRGVPPQLSTKRRRKIENAINLYGVDICFKAIDGVLLSDFHQGENSRGKKYDDIELILRDEEHVEQFANIAIEAELGGAGAKDFLNDDHGKGSEAPF